MTKAVPQAVDSGNQPAIADIIASNTLLADALAEANMKIEALTRANNTPLAQTPKKGDRPLFARVRIILEESDEIAPSGQFFGIHGTWVNPKTLEALEKEVRAGDISREEAHQRATERVMFEAILRPGEEADVPVELLENLNNAVKEIAELDPATGQVLRWRKRSRYPYRIVSSA